MGLVQRVVSSPLEARRALGLVSLIVLAAMIYGTLQIVHSAGRDGRCQELLTNKHRTDYIRFEVEGCGAYVEPAARAAEKPLSVVSGVVVGFALTQNGFSS